MKAFSKDNSFSFSYLYDEDQSVAKAYHAVCTPNFFGYNMDSKLQYRSRLDASRKEAGPEDLKGIFLMLWFKYQKLVSDLLIRYPLWDAQLNGVKSY